MKARIVLALLAVGAASQIAMSGCATWSHKEKGAAIGAGAGAAAGAMIGKATGSVARGAVIGAVLGGTAGAVIRHQMDQQAKEIQATVPGATVTRVGEGMVVTFESGLLFDFDKAALRPAARENLQKLAESLQKYPGENVLVVGHTDSIGGQDYNLRLSQQRADAAAAYLRQLGVAADRIRTRGMGEGDPVASNSTEAGRQENRRVEVALYAGEAWKRQAQQQVGMR